jgi:hypothetical protein
MLAAGDQSGHFLGARIEGGDPERIAAAVGPQHRERIVVPSLEKARDGVGVERRGRKGGHPNG